MLAYIDDIGPLKSAQELLEEGAKSDLLDANPSPVIDQPYIWWRREKLHIRESPIMDQT